MLRVRHLSERMEAHKQRLAAAVKAFESAAADYALVGGHAVSLYAEPRVTVAVAFLVATQDLPRVREALEKSGHRVVEARDAIMVFGADEDPSKAEAVVELLSADLLPIWKAALATAVAARYLDLPVRVVTRAALLALKFAAALSADRPREDRLLDLSDLARLARTDLSPSEAQAARDLAEAAFRGGGAAFDKLLDDLRSDRPITA